MISPIKKYGIRTAVCCSVLAMLCLGTFLLALPTIGQNVGDPNMIIYFNTDEGGLMDEAWYYYSGSKRDSFQWDFDYGLEMVYLAGFARIVLSKFVDITPGLLVLLLRWIHLIAWVLSLLALWKLIGRHFGSGWQQVLPVALLATRPSLDYLSNTLKPEALVLLFMIIGLDYALRILDSPSKKYVLFASAMAALAFIVKFAGLFLLPAIVASLYLAKRCHEGLKSAMLRTIRISWMLPGLFGFIIIAFPLMLITLYTRKSTGLTWYAQYGFRGSVSQNPVITQLLLAGALLIIFSIALSVLTRQSHGYIKKYVGWINEINSYALIAFSLFAGFVALFGFKWLIDPQHFINIYGQLGPIAMQKGYAIAEIASKGWMGYFFERLASRIMVFDPAILALCVFYVFAEIACWRKSISLERSGLYKRLVLLVFTLPLFANLFSSGRLEKHNVLPFFTAASILGIQGVVLFRRHSTASLKFRNVVSSLCIAVLLVDIILNGSSLIKARLYRFHQQEDVAFDIAKWWRDNIPNDANVVAEHYSRVYIPPGQKNVKVLHWNGLDKANELRRLVSSRSPRYIYFKEEAEELGGIPPLESLLPGKRISLVKAFESSGRRYQRHPDEKFVIYEVLD